MSAIATMKAVVDTEQQQRQQQRQLQYQRQLQQQPQQEPPSPYSTSQPMAESQSQHPKLMIVPAATANPTPSTFSEVPSPTLSTSSLTSSLSSNSDGTEAVSFSFSSPLFYDQKLCIYHSLLKVYRLLGRCIDKHPTVLIMLQYSIAVVHGFTIYLLSVILSIAQLIMITVTMENLDWIQSYTPLMCEWDSRFPGFVFPALDIDSEAEEEVDNHAPDSWAHKDSLYWEKCAKLKEGEDLVDDGYQSEESMKRLTVQQSMNSRLRRRFARYQQWMPTFWSTDEGQVEEAGEDSDATLARRHVSDLKDEPYPYSGAFQKAIVRNKRVTFNEQVQVMGRKRSSESRSSRPVPEPMKPVAPPAYNQEADHLNANLDSFISNASCSPAKPSFLAAPLDQFAAERSTVMETSQEPASAAKTSSQPVVSQDMVASLVVDQMATNMEQLEAMKREEAEYQQSIAAKDTNGSGASSPVLSLETQPAAPESTTLPSLTDAALALSQQKPTVPLPTNKSDPTAVNPVNDQRDLRRSSSVPLKIGALFGRHAKASAQESSSKRASTFSEMSSVQPSSRVIPPHLTSWFSLDKTGSNNATTSAPQQDNTGRTVSPRSSLSLGTRAKRSISLVVPGTGSGANAGAAAPAPAKEEGSALDRRASTGKRNFMFKIVHPQRYKREVEQQVVEQERQRLLSLVHLQRQHILGAEGDADCQEFGAESFGADPVICGDPYYYATSAEYVEGLGAQDSVISTSVGTSFPEELQGNKSSKSRSKLHPLSLDCPSSIATGIHRDTRATRVADSIEKKGSQLMLFKRDSKKSKRQGTESVQQGSPRINSSNRLQQLFGGGFQPGQKETQSTSSLVQPPGPFLTKSQTGSKDSLGKSASKAASQRLPLPRTTSRQFTTFKALGTPACPPAQPLSSSPTPMSSMSSDLEVGPVASSSEMEHTSFSAFGFPSPVQSPESSMPSSPRHSTSSMPADTPSRLQAMNDFYRGTVSRNPFKQSNKELVPKQEVLLYDLDDEDFAQGPKAEVMPLATATGAREETGLGVRVSVESNGPTLTATEPLEATTAAAKSGRGMSFMRKLTSKKKKSEK